MQLVIMWKMPRRKHCAFRKDFKYRRRSFQITLVYHVIFLVCSLSYFPDIFTHSKFIYIERITHPNSLWPLNNSQVKCEAARMNRCSFHMQAEISVISRSSCCHKLFSHPSSCNRLWHKLLCFLTHVFVVHTHGRLTNELLYQSWFH